MNKNSILMAKIGILLPIVGGFFGFPTSSILNLGGVIMVVVAHNYFAKYYGENRIFKDYLIGNIISFVFSAVGVGILVSMMLNSILPAVLDEESISWDNLSEALRQLSTEAQDNPEVGEKIVEAVSAQLGMLLSGSALLLFALIASSLFIKRSLTALAESSGINQFKTAGLLYLIGSITAMLLVGFLLIFVGFIFHIVGYFSMRSA